MNKLFDFVKKVETQLAKANREPRWKPGEADRFMAEVGERRECFEQMATRLNDRIVRPRLEALASCLDNASLTKNEPAGCCSCWFGYCERFPSSTKVTFTIEHDIHFEKTVVAFEAFMMPMFIKFNEHDKLTRPNTEMTDDIVADWVEERLLEFLDAYLQTDRGGLEADEEPATDPVCGMRIIRSTAAAQGSYHGHAYYFCSSDCQSKFLKNPTAFVQMKLM